MEKNKENIRQAGLKALSSLTKAEQADINKLIEIESKYELGYNCIVEFCDRKFHRPMYALTHYCQLKFPFVLKLIKANESKLDENQTYAQIIASLTNISSQKAEKLVNETDERDHAYAEMFGKKFANALAQAINASNGAHGITKWDKEEAKKTGLSLNEYLFLSTFNREMGDDELFEQ